MRSSFLKALCVSVLVPIIGVAQFSATEKAAWQQQAKQVTIIRDNWGIPHVYGKTDADAVFGLMYAECEDNLDGVEKNSLSFLGRMSEAQGRSQLYQDLQMRLIYDSTDAISDYRNSPPWMKKLCNAFAAGVNYYLLTHPEAGTLILRRFEPWYAFMNTDGGIASTETGGLRMADIIELYGKRETDKTAFQQPPVPAFQVETAGSNGFAVGPAKSATGNAMLYINPHVTFYFRTEAQMVSNEGLNAYGAATWGQFFIYQGFNQHCGWMHTTGYSDAADLYEEKVQQKGNAFTSAYDGRQMPVTQRKITIHYKENGVWNKETFTTYRSLHGPVMGSRNGRWLSLKAVNHSLNGLLQSWLRTKADGFEAFKKTMALRTNISNNTTFADDKGNIAYWHGNAVPRRDTAYDYSSPVDGSTSATNWKGLYEVDETVHKYNPTGGWLQSCNSTPFAVAGNESPLAANYPVYMAPDGQNPRSVNAIRLLSRPGKLTQDEFITQIGYSHYLAAFDVLLPVLLKAYENLPETDSLKASLKMPVTMLQGWDKNATLASMPATIAIEWAERLSKEPQPPHGLYYASHNMEQLQAMANNVTGHRQLVLFSETLSDLSSRFGVWQISWGNLNRYQRPATGVFSDTKPSLPVGFSSSGWGSIPSFGVTRPKGENLKYGVAGNSFIACIEFGKQIKAKSVVTGGESTDPASPHYTDQAQRYIDGNLKDVLFYKEDVLQHIEQQYHPGERRGAN